MGAPGAEGWGPPEDRAALGCEEMMRAVSGSSRDRLKETLIDPENRDARGRNVTQPGTDVEQECGRGGGGTADLTKRRCALGTFLERPSLTRTGAKSAEGPRGSACIREEEERRGAKMHPYGRLPQKKTNAWSVRLSEENTSPLTSV